MNINLVVLGGNLTRDVELKYTQSNTAIARFTIANNKKWTSSSGEKKEDVAFIDCTAWGKTAETIAKFFGKGQKIAVTGRLKQEVWNDKEDGKKRSKIGVTVDSFEFVGDSKGGAKKESDDGYSVAKKPASQPADQLYVANPDEDAPF